MVRVLSLHSCISGGWCDGSKHLRHGHSLVCGDVHDGLVHREVGRGSRTRGRGEHRGGGSDSGGGGGGGGGSEGRNRWSSGCHVGRIVLHLLHLISESAESSEHHLGQLRGLDALRPKHHLSAPTFHDLRQRIDVALQRCGLCPQLLGATEGLVKLLLHMEQLCIHPRVLLRELVIGTHVKQRG